MIPLFMSMAKESAWVINTTFLLSSLPPSFYIIFVVVEFVLSLIFFLPITIPTLQRALLFRPNNFMYQRIINAEMKMEIRSIPPEFPFKIMPPPLPFKAFFFLFLMIIF